MSSLDSLRQELAALVAKGGPTNPHKDQATEWLAKWKDAGGSDDDAAVKVAQLVFGATAPKPAKEAKGAPQPNYATIEFDFLEGFMRDVLECHGVPAEEAKVAASVLIESDKRGIDSHGIGRLKPIYCDRIKQGILKPTAPITVVHETETTAVVDGNLGLGLFIGPHCMGMAIEKAKAHGIGMVTVKNSTHYGMAGFYALQACRAGCVGMTTTNARPSIAPTFGVEGMLGTNPITWGFPSDDPFPFVIDCATSINQRGKIEKYAREGLPTPPGQVIDRDGRIRTDTDQILKDLVSGQCSLAPLGGPGIEMGGYKGFGYATVVELLSTAFSDAKTSPDCRGVDLKTGEKAPMPLGHSFLAINIEAFTDLESFKSRVGTFLRRLRASDKDPNGPGRIFTAGEIEYETQQKRMKNGGTPVPEALQKDMLDLRSQFPKLQEKYPKFPFEK